MLKKSLYFTIIVSLGCTLLSGCIIRPAAKSIVTIERTDGIGQKITFGLKHAYWIEDQDGIHLAAYGWHPREHETYCFFICESDPVVLFRKILLKPIINPPAKTKYQVNAKLSGWCIHSDNESIYDWHNIYAYSGQLDVNVSEYFSTWTISLSGLKLYPDDKDMPILLMEGKVIAKPNTDKGYQRIVGIKAPAKSHIPDRVKP